jgi:hypothetical protein
LQKYDVLLLFQSAVTLALEAGVTADELRALLVNGSSQTQQGLNDVIAQLPAVN